MDCGAKSVVLLAALETHGFPPTARLIKDGIEPSALASYLRVRVRGRAVGPTAVQLPEWMKLGRSRSEGPITREGCQALVDNDAMTCSVGTDGFIFFRHLQSASALCGSSYAAGSPRSRLRQAFKKASIEKVLFFLSM